MGYCLCVYYILEGYTEFFCINENGELQEGVRGRKGDEIE